MTAKPLATGEPSAPVQPVRENIQRIAELEAAARRELTASERISKRITDFAGSMRFVLLHVGLFVGWALWNGAAPAFLRFDPYPFGLLTMAVSLEGVLLATLVLITQNRIMLHTERRDHLTLQVSMLTEQELTAVLRMLRQVCERLGIEPTAVPHGVEQLMEETNVYQVVQQLDQELPRD